jgi:hypothetical protein
MPGRTLRQCRERWLNYLSPETTNALWTVQEEKILEQKVFEFNSALDGTVFVHSSRDDPRIRSGITEYQCVMESLNGQLRHLMYLASSLMLPHRPKR